MVRVAIIGCGVLGVKIAGSLAHAGHQVRLYDEDNLVLNEVNLRLGEDRRVLREDGFLVGNNFSGDVYCFSSLEDAVRGCQFILESITENLELKQQLFKRIEAICPEDAIFSTSTMRLSVDDIFRDMTARERCLGIRFLFPVYFIPEVELVATKYTSLNTLEQVRQFLERMGRVAFFRSGPEPIVLSEEQRDSRKNAFIRHMNDQKGHRLALPVPDLWSLNSVDIELTARHAIDGIDNRKEKECVVCMDTDRDCLLHPCHHLCTCMTCGKLLFCRHDACPICRHVITNVIRVFHS
ncbi:hydroxyacyl-coenzyme A dehydrogenase, mitochondrial-like [Brevipalpus obovatus]|uniref:hydroxyacyl-coenzyme A dehydrogenase, mitochondrial-like n=1 Tax=Brevipalpus obovatus TaxID=246614 RepID=UPI003D9E8762